MRPDTTRDGPRAMPHGDRRPTSSPPSAEAVPTITRPGDNDRHLTGRGLADAVTLPCDQIPTERRTIGDATGRLGEHNGVLGVALAQWAARDDSKPEPEIRRAANTAMDSVDAMLGELYALRARLVAEIRESDDLAAERADATLARLRAARELAEQFGARLYCLCGRDSIGDDGRCARCAEDEP